MKRLNFVVLAILSLVLVLAACLVYASGGGVPPAGLVLMPPDPGAAGLGAFGAAIPMAGLLRNKITNIQPLAPGATATLVIGTGKNAPTLDGIQLILGAGSGSFNAAHITGMRGYINGRECYVDGSGTVHNARATYMGIHTDTAEVHIDFTEPNARSAVEQNLSSIPLALIQDFRFELDISGTASSSLTLTAYALFRAPTNNPYIKKIRKITQGFAAGGEQVVYLPNGPSGGKLVRVWIHETSPGNITAAELRARNAVGIEGTRAAIQLNQERWGLVPQTGVLVLDFIQDGNLAGWFDTSALSDVELRLTGTAADTYTIYLEYLDPIGRL